MKKLLALTVFFVLGFTQYSFGQQKGDVWLGGSSNAGLTLSPLYLGVGFHADYFLTNPLSVGLNSSLSLSSSYTYFSLAPQVSYFVTEDLYAQVIVDVLEYSGGDVDVGLNSITARLGYWMVLHENAVASPAINLYNISESPQLGLSLGFKLRLPENYRPF